MNPLRDAAASKQEPSPGELRARRIGPGDSEAAAVLLARAFCDNPLNEAVVGGHPRRRYRCNLHGMRSLLAAASGARADVLCAGSDPRGVLVGLPPDCQPLPPAPLAVQLRAAFGQGPRVLVRWNRVYAQLQEVHPIEPHCYLGVLGVDPDSQSRGVGTALLERWLADVDEDGLPSYLETDRERNLAFYAKAGFEVSKQLSVLGATVWCMWRPARANSRA